MDRSDPVVGTFKIKGRRPFSSGDWIIAERNGKGSLASGNKIIGKLFIKDKSFYKKTQYNYEQKCKGDGTILDGCNPMETILKGQGNTKAVEALADIDKEIEKAMGMVGIESMF